MIIVRPNMMRVVPMGINKSNSQSISSSTDIAVTGWTVRSGYPETVISNDGIIVEGGGDAILTGSFNVNMSGFGGSFTAIVSLMHNSTVVESINTGSISWLSGAQTRSFANNAISVSSGDRIWLAARRGGSTSFKLNAGTYVQLDSPI